MDFEINNTGADSSSTQLDTFGASNSLTDDLEVSGTCNFTNYCAKWILKTIESRRLTRIATIGIVEDISELIKEDCSCVEDQVKNCLR